MRYDPGLAAMPIWYSADLTARDPENDSEAETILNVAVYR
jgi:hypothetical protein